MTPEEMQARIIHLEGIVDKLALSDRYDFTKDIQVRDSRKIHFGITKGTTIGTGTTQKIGFWGVTPVIQPIADTGTVGHYAIGGTAVLHQDQFTGSDVASSRYSINGIVDSLKAVGILKR